MITTLNEQITIMQGQVEARFSQHPDAEIIGSQPGLGPILGARVPGEFGDGPHRHTSDKARKNYAPTSPLTRQPGRRQTVIARYVHNDPLRDALDRQASAAPATSPRARAHHDQLRARGAGHNAALRQLAHRPAGTLHGCLKNPHPPPPGDRLAPAHQARNQARGLTFKLLGCLPALQP